jgi:hypothetical protein
VEPTNMNNLSWQLDSSDPSLPDYIKESINRYTEFHFSNSQIYNIHYTNFQNLLDYLNYHQENNFSVLTFEQTVRDIKNITKYLRNYLGIEDPPYINFSIRHHRLWLSELNNNH